MSLCLALAGTAAAVWLMIAVLPWQPHRTRERIAAAADPIDLSTVTVLIPARNEAAHIAATLAALAQQGSDLHVIVIDDRSDDATASIARSFAAEAAGISAALRIDVLDGRPLAAGWGGKLWALEQGLACVERPWCLLLDADIVLAPHFIPALVQAAQRESAVLVSVMATLQCESLWERLLVPPFVFFFKLLYPFALVADSTSRIAAAAGGCVFVETQALQRVGAFSTWADALIDDCTLARHIKRHEEYADRPPQLLMSRDVVSSRAYLQLKDFWQMVTRTAYTQLHYSVALLLLTTLVMITVFIAPIGAIVVADGLAARLAGGVALLAMIGDFAPVARFYRVPVIWYLTLPVAAVLFLAMTWHSALLYHSGTRATWKSRQYDSKA